MANRRLTPQKASVTGLNATVLTDILIADLHQVRNNGRVFLRIDKTGSTDAILTFTSTAKRGGLAVADPTATVPATTGKRFIGPFLPQIFNNENGDLEWSVDNVTGLECEIIQL